MLVACRLADLSALEGHYAGVRVSAQFGGARVDARLVSFGCRRTGPPPLPSRPATVSKALARSLEASGGRGFR